jgi:rhombotail lipoprotein
VFRRAIENEKIMKKKFWLNLGMLATVAALAAGCRTWGQNERHHANSLYNYLYASQAGHLDAETIPVLSLPLRVGIAFVPPDSSRRGGGYGFPEDGTLSENQKMDLMQQITAQFKNYPFIKSVELIPTPYLTPKGGFANLEQIRTMYGVDVMVLLSYDQVQFTDQGLLSLSYWTIVGAYVIQGEKNDTQTMLDGAVYDIASHKLLFRAPGLSTVKGSATPVNLSEQLRQDSERGFTEAATNLVAGMKVQLDEFKQRVKNAPTEFKIVAKPGYTGASAFGELEAVLTCAMGVCYLWTRRKIGS